MARAILILIVFIGALSAPEGNSGGKNNGKTPKQTSESALTPQEGPTRVTIATAGSFLGSLTDHYRVGDQIPITITMTNTSTGRIEVCISSDLYQNLPKLTRDGHVVPYMKWQSYERLNAQRNHTCEEENLPETILLGPNEPKLVDWFMLSDGRTATGAEAWYDSLSPGKYELSIQRRLNCCEGPMVDSNKISFQVTP